jgi:hypothetical protein
VSMIQQPIKTLFSITSLVFAAPVLLLGCDIGLDALNVETGSGPLGGDTEINTTDTGGANSSGNNPTVDDFVVEETNDKVRFEFNVSDIDNDMVGGEVTLVVGQQTVLYNYPEDIREDNNSEFVLWETNQFTPENQVACRVIATDATGLSSSPVTYSFTMSVWSITSNEVGDEPSQVDGLGLIQIPGEILGNAHSTGNNGSAYAGDFDVMRFTSPKSGPASFGLTWSASGADYDLMIADMTGAVLANSSTNGTSFENFSYNLSSQTDYLLAVGAWSGPGGDWIIRIE